MLKMFRTNDPVPHVCNAWMMIINDISRGEFETHDVLSCQFWDRWQLWHICYTNLADSWIEALNYWLWTRLILQNLQIITWTGVFLTKCLGCQFIQYCAVTLECAIIISLKFVLYLSILSRSIHWETTNYGLHSFDSNKALR